MKIFKIFRLITLSALISVTAQAKTIDNTLPSLYHAEWEKSLKLTPKQSAQIKSIRDQNQEKLNIYLMQIETIRYEIDNLMEENNNQIRNVLTEKQKVKFDTYRYKLKKRLNEHEDETKPSRKKMKVYKQSL